MPISTPGDFDRVLQESQKLLAASRKLAKLVDAQSKAIEMNDLETVEAVLEQKQSFIEELQKIPHLKATFEDSISSVPHLIAEPLTLIYSELNRDLESIGAAERAAMARLSDHRAEIARSLQLLMEGREILECYNLSSNQQTKSRIDISS
jgi:hypothetical protein